MRMPWSRFYMTMPIQNADGGKWRENQYAESATSQSTSQNGSTNIEMDHQDAKAEEKDTDQKALSVAIGIADLV